MTALPQLGPNLLRIRTRRRLSRHRLARAVGVTEATIWNYEHGNTIPPASLLYLIAWHLDIPVSVLYQSDPCLDRAPLSVPDGVGVFAPDGMA